MRIFWILWFVLLALVATIVFIWISPESAGSSGETHSQFSTLSTNNSAVSSQRVIPVLSFIFGFLVTLILHIAIFIGARKKGQPNSFNWWITGITIAYLGIYTLMSLSYWNYEAGTDGSYFLAFPVPSAWMMYGIWFFPILFTLVYIVKFDDWVLRPEDLERFRQLKASVDQKDKN